MLKFILLLHGIITTRINNRRQIALICCLSFVFYFYTPAKAQGTLHTIVIDPGHGGIDIGCHGDMSYEKNVALGVSLKLAEYIHKNWPDVKVILTRTTDQFVDLGERAEIANRAKADLFLCIHCNANPNRSAYGTETYVMGLHKTEGNLMVAQRENQSIKYEKDYQNKYDGFDPNSPEGYIQLTMNQSAFLDQSIYLASKIEEDFKADKRFSRGVKQAGFLVLWRTTMPSLLCETGFLTNPTEEKYLNSTRGQYEIAAGLFEAIKKYRMHYENKPDIGATISPDSATKAFSKPMVSSIPVDTPHKTPNVSVNTKAVSPANTAHAPTLTTIDNSPIQAPAKDTAGKNTITFYRVQLGVVPAQNTTADYNKLGVAIIKEPLPNKNVRIMAGYYNSIGEAKEALEKIHKGGYRDAYIVQYTNGRRTKEIYR